MRYNVAVKALLKRLGQNENALNTEVPQSLVRQVTLSTLRTCQRFSATWRSESYTDTPFDALDDAHDSALERHARNVAKWGHLPSHLPALLLHLELSRINPCLSNNVVTHDRLAASLLRNIPRPHCSLLVYGLYRSLLLSLLPSDLRNMTSTNIFVLFVCLSAIKVIHEESAGDEESYGGRELRHFPKTQSENQAVANVVARLPRGLKAYFTIDDDAPLLRRLCAEFTRRLPASGESFHGDYVKTLADAGATGDARMTYLFAVVQGASSTQQVSREEFIMFLPKLNLIEAKTKRLRFFAQLQHTEELGLSTKRRMQSEYYTENAAVAIANALSHLCLLHHIADIASVRLLNVTEWMFLISASTSSEPRWSVQALPALRTALRIAEEQRVARGKTQNSFGGAKESLFPHMHEARQCWMLRGFIGSLFAMRNNGAQLRGVINATVPLLWEYARQLRRADELTVRRLFELHNVMQGLWVVTRLLWYIDSPRAAALSGTGGRGSGSTRDGMDANEDDDADGDNREPIAFQAWAAAEESTEMLREDDVLAVSNSIISTVETALVSSGYFTDLLATPHVTAVAPDPAVVSSTAATADSTPAPPPKRGSGFARSTQVPRLVRSPVCSSNSRRSRQRQVKEAALVQLYLDAQLTYCTVVLERFSDRSDMVREVVATALRVLPVSAALAGPDLEKIRRGVEDHLSFDTVSNGHSPHDSSQWSEGRKVDPYGRLPARLVREIDVYSHQRPTALRLIGQLLQLTGDHALSTEERVIAVGLVADAAKEGCTLLDLFLKAQYVHTRMERLVHESLNCYAKHVVPILAHADAGTAVETLQAYQECRHAMQQLAHASLNTVHHVWSSSSDLSLSALRSMSPRSPGAAARCAVHLSLVRLVDYSISLGSAAGLTSEEMPHLTSTLHRSFDTLTVCARCGRPSSSDVIDDMANAAGAPWSNKTMQVWGIAMQRMCILGVYDAACLAAATEALRRCGVEENIAAMANRQREQFLFHVIYAFRVLAPRYSVSREVRHLMHQLLVVAARMTVDRLAYRESMPSRGTGKSTRSRNSDPSNPQIIMELCGQAMLLWQLASNAVACTGSSPAVDRSINALLQFAKRHLVVPTPPGYAPHAPHTTASDIAHLERLEGALHNEAYHDFKLWQASSPPSDVAYFGLSNTVMRSVLDATKPTYRRISSDLHNTPTQTQRLRWQSHMETFATVVQRFQQQLAPSLWHRVARESLMIHHVLVFPNLHTPLMQEVLLRAIDRVLLYSAAHNNTGTWFKDSAQRRSEARSLAANDEDFVYSVAKTQLIPYFRAVRYLAFQEQLVHMDRRVYLVELVDRLAVEVAEVERRGEVPVFMPTFAVLAQEGQKETSSTIVTAGRSQLLGTFRRARL